jgi:hypothetical protein
MNKAQRLEMELMAGDLHGCASDAAALLRAQDEALRMALDALIDSRDDVSEYLNRILELKGYERYDKRIAAYEEQLVKHDAAITELERILK